MTHTKWWWVGHLFTYVKTCERGCDKDFEKQSRVCNVVRYNVIFPVDPDNLVIMESQCICNRWKIVVRPSCGSTGARTQGLSLTVRILYHWATEPSGHITNNPPPETYLGYTHNIICLGDVMNSINFCYLVI